MCTQKHTPPKNVKRKQRANIYIFNSIFAYSSWIASCQGSEQTNERMSVLTYQDNALCTLCTKTEKVRYPTSSLSTLPCFTSLCIAWRAFQIPLLSQRFAVTWFSISIHIFVIAHTVEIRTRHFELIKYYSKFMLLSDHYIKHLILHTFEKITIEFH